MTRPLARAGIDELEALFQANEQNSDELKILESELTFRNTLRATALLDKLKRQRVRSIIDKAKVRVAESSVAKQPPQTLNDTSPKPSETLAAIPSSVSAPVGSPAKPVDPAPGLMTMEQAYRILKVSASATWESIEQSRRELVARAQPDKLAGLPEDKKKAVQDETRLVNAAYRLLAQSKN